MRVVIQRVSKASVTNELKAVNRISSGLVIFLGIEEADTPDDVAWLCNKTTGLRIFSDSSGVMNHSIMEVKGEIMVISQFTLHASTRKGNRPSYIKAARPEKAIPLYEHFIKLLQTGTGLMVQTGWFGAHMQVELINDGPVTILMDSRNRE